MRADRRGTLADAHRRALGGATPCRRSGCLTPPGGAGLMRAVYAASVKGALPAVVNPTQPSPWKGRAVDSKLPTPLGQPCGLPTFPPAPQLDHHHEGSPMSRWTLVVPTDPHLRPELLAAAVADAAREARVEIAIVIPAVLPLSLPIDACPPKLAARLRALRDAARAALAAHGSRGSAEIVPCRSVPGLLQALAATRRGEPAAHRVVLVGSAGWAVRRAARGLHPRPVVVPVRSRP